MPFSTVKVFLTGLRAVIAAVIFSPVSAVRQIKCHTAGRRQVTLQTLAAQVMSLLLIVCLLTTSTPAAAPMLLWASVGEAGQDARYSYLNGGLANFGAAISGANSTLAASLSSASFGELLGTVAPVLGLITGKHIFKKRGQQKEAPQRIVILPTNETNTLTVLQGEKINLTAVGLGKDDQPLGGLQFIWTVADNTRQGAPRPLANGNFEAKSTGVFAICAEASGKSAQVTVVVSPNGGAAVQRALQKKDESRTEGERKLLAKVVEKGKITIREISTKGKHDSEEEERLSRETKRQLEEIKGKQTEFLRQLQNGNPQPQNLNQPPINPNQPRPPGGPNAGETEESAVGSGETKAEDDAETTAKAAAAENADAAFAVEIEREAMIGSLSAAAMRPPDEDFWDGGNYWEATNPGNSVGSTPGMAPASGAANGNFSLAAPIVSLPGRGLDVNLSLYYNSRLWSKAGGTISYDPDKGNPAPGWNLGFGKMINLGGAGCLIVDAGGSRHSHGGSSSTYNYSGYYSNYYAGHTEDGSFVDYNCSYYSNPYGSGFGATAYLPNGTRIDYNSPTGSRDQAYPTQITDAQGNYITITYVNNQGPNIQTITDTLGRVVTFNYDGGGKLVSVTGPGQNGGTRVLVRLHYAQLNLNYAFNGLTPDTPTNSPAVIDAIYYPVTNTGYWFGDGGGDPSYSSYGMLAKVMGMRSMSWSGANNNDQGTITAGQMSHQEKYNFPLGPDGSLTDAPLYTTQTETWHAMEGTPAAVTTYGVSSTATEETITVTAPNGTKSVQTSFINPGAWNDGVYYKNETKDAANVVLGKTQTFMQQGDWGSFRPTRIESTDERNQTIAAEFEYANGVYNQVTRSRQLNYANQLYRDTRTAYENNSAYLNRHLFSLVKAEEIFDAGGNRLARTDYEYDNNAVANGTGNPNLVNTPNVIMHNYRSDPYTTTTIEGQNCASIQYYECGSPPEYSQTCEYCAAYEQVSAYEPNTIYRGNLTKTTTYADAANLSGAIAYDSTYDITGNARTTTTNCCQQMAFDYNVVFQYAYPTQMTKGSADPNSPLRMTQSSWYDYSTGVQTQATDFNGRSTYYYYDQAQRPTYIAFPTGGKRTFGYDDNALYLYDFTREANDTVAGGTLTYLNGRGQPRGQSTIIPAGGGSSSEWRFDAMGRKTQISLPYAGNTPTQWTTYAYDALSRPVQVSAPDGSVSQTFYNEAIRPSSATAAPGQTVRSRDAWGRERWARSDDFGRTVEVVEPDPNGSGAVFSAGNLATSYNYDPLDRLTQTNQGSQVRAFRYDSLGRLIRQKLAEQTATINDAGVYAGAGNGLWSDAFVYDARSNLIQRTDARGVKTNYDYSLAGAVDPLNRLRQVTYDQSNADPTYPVQAVAPVTLDYMTAGDKTRVRLVSSGGGWTEENSYDVEGRVSEYKVTTVVRPNEPMQTNYLYDTTSRLTEVRYPNQWGMPGSPRKVVTTAFDEASRLKELRVNNQIHLNEITYNPLSQVTRMKTADDTPQPDIETYQYDNQTGLLTNQKIVRVTSGQTLLDQSYEYQRGNSSGTANGKTGQLTRITNNLDHNKNRLYEFDSLGRLKTAKGGLGAGVGNPTANWQQQYSYDRFGNRFNIAASGMTANSQAVPTDGIPNQSYDSNSNRISTQGYIYDLAGNLVRGQKPDGSWQKFEYDQAGRLSIVRNDATNQIEYGNGYTSSRQRISSFSDANPGVYTYYAWGGAAVIAEYTTNANNNQATSVWKKNYIYAGSRLLSTQTNNNQGGETQEFHHPDRLGTKLVTNSQIISQFEQSTLPFGTALDAESTGATNQRFTSYDRSTVAQLDYAVNRSYSAGQGRFTSPDPIGMSAASLGNPQSMNMYAYVENNPVDYVDPTGLFMASPKERDWSESDRELFLHFLRDSLELSRPPIIDPGHDSGGGGSDGIPAPLNEKEDEKFDKSVKKINKKVQEKKCNDFLKNHGISASDITNTLANHQPFSGPRSTDISTRDAGLYDSEQLAKLDQLIKTGGRIATSAQYELSRSVAQYFKDGDGSKDGRKVGAVVANYNGNPNTAFYRSFDSAKILHESLHIVTGLNDINLSEKLGAGKFSDSKLASSAINTALKNNGCKF